MTEPAAEAVTVFVTVPELTVAAPRPVRLPVPAVRAKVTDVVLSVVTTLPCASSIDAV